MKTIALTLALVLLTRSIHADAACEASFDAQRSHGDVAYFNEASVADVDGDGLPDLVLSTGEGPAVAFGRGDGTFGPVMRIAGWGVSKVADVTGDALPDLITYDAIVHENRGGSFAPAMRLGAINESLMAVGDFTGDGRADVLTVDSTRLHPRIYAGGTPLAGREITMQPPVNYSIANTIGDVDGDGNLDLVSSGQNEKKIRIDYGNGAGDFTRTETHVIDGIAAGVTVADFDGSGRADIVYVTAAGGTQIILDAGSPAHLPDVTTAVAAFHSADIDADGVPDLVSYGNGQIGVYRNDGHAHFTLTARIFATSFTLGDVDLDGFADFVVTTENGFAVVPGRGDGTFDKRRRDLVAGRLAASGDVNGDGLDELFVVTPANELVALYTDGHSELLPVTPAGAPVSVAANGEVLLRTSHVLFVLGRRNDGTWTMIRSLTRDTSGAMLADLDGNGANEIVLAEQQAVTASIEVIDDMSDAELFRAEVPKRPSYSFAAGDADEDGRPDLFAAASGTFATIPHAWVNRDGYLRAWFGAGNGTFGEEHVLIENESFAQPRRGDFNGDGHFDLALLAVSDYVSQLYVLLGDGTGAFVDRPPASASPFIGDIATGDVNGDGIDDIVTWLGNELTLFAGVPGGFANRGSFWIAGYPSSGVLARLRRNAPLSAVFNYSDEGVIGAIDGVCAQARRRGVRH